MLISEDFLDDFDDDDDAFFSSATTTSAAAAIAGVADTSLSDGVVEVGAEAIGSRGHNITSMGGGEASSPNGIDTNFGMLVLGYADSGSAATTSNLRRKNQSTTTAATGGSSPTTTTSLGVDAFHHDEQNYDETDNDDIITTNNDVELLDFDRRYLSHLRNPNSTYSIVAPSCLALHQLVYNNNCTSISNNKDGGRISHVNATSKRSRAYEDRAVEASVNMASLRQ